MAVKPFGFLLDRLRLALTDALCPVCRDSMPPKMPGFICPTCEQQLMVRHAVPIMTVSKAPIYTACEFPFRLKRLLYQLKFNNQAELGFPLSQILLHYWQQLPQAQQSGWTVVMIPPHADSALAQLPLLARPLASHFGYDFLENGLQWRHPIQAQHTIYHRRKRRQNIQGALEVHPALAQRLQPKSRILIMDDLMTTGATLSEAVKAFQKVSPDISVTALATAHVPFSLGPTW